MSIIILFVVVLKKSRIICITGGLIVVDDGRRTVRRAVHLEDELYPNIVKNNFDLTSAIHQRVKLACFQHDFHSLLLNLGKKFCYLQNETAAADSWHLCVHTLRCIAAGCRTSLQHPHPEYPCQFHFPHILLLLRGILGSGPGFRVLVLGF